MRLIPLAMLLGCGDQIELAPDAAVTVIADAAPIEPACTVTRESLESAPAPFGGCLVKVTAAITCSTGSYNRAVLGWVRLSDTPRTSGLAEVTYRCGESISASFTVPCEGATDVGAAMQHPQLGGDLYADVGPRIVCELIP